MTKHTKEQMLSFRVSTRIAERLQKVLKRDGEQMSEFLRLATLRRLEQREREGESNGA